MTHGCQSCMQFTCVAWNREVSVLYGFFSISREVPNHSAALPAYTICFKKTIWRHRLEVSDWLCMLYGSGLILSPRCPFLLYVIFGYTVYFVSLVGPCLNRAGLTSFIRNLPIQRLCDNQPTFYISPCVLLESHQPASIFEPHKQRIKQIALFRINLRFCHPFVIWSSYPFNFSTSSQIPPIDQASSCPLFHASCPFPFASPRSPLVR